MTENRYALHKPIHETKVVVAMSGGVDSSVVAVKLHKEGYQVIGMTMQLYDHGVAIEKSGACCAGKDIYDARKIASQFGFPHYVLNYESVFKEEVMDDFADSYLRGETPIPCVKCNQSVKFRDLYRMAKELDADALVTGHYVQRKRGKERYELHKAFDHTKDQSYFLFATTQEQLDYVDFPLGGLRKEQTRELALSYGLDVADKPDSQDICFVPDGSYARVVERLRPGALDAGEIVHLNGTVLGEHNGIINYTIGQRRGLGVSWSDPLYVVKLDVENNRVIVGSKDNLDSTVFYIQSLNWIADSPIDPDGLEASVRLRSAHSGVAATLYPTEVDGKVKVELHEPQRAVSPGQACVVYEDERLLGGGWIMRDVPFSRATPHSSNTDTVIPIIAG